MPFNGNMADLDSLAALSLVGLSRVVEVPYTSVPVQPFLGNNLAAGCWTMSLGTGSRTVEISYTSSED
jgi:hypothetical protein